MKISIIFGNPPYNIIKDNGANITIYSEFMDAAEHLAPRTILVTPARFLFDAGKTPKAWNHKKLEDPHFRICKYYPDSKECFPSIRANGGIVITERDKNTAFEPIKEFFTYPALGSVVKKVRLHHPELKTNNITSTIIQNPKLDIEEIKKDFPAIAYKLSSQTLETNIFAKLPEIFTTKVNNNENEIKVHGLFETRYTTRWIKKQYIRDHVDTQRLAVSRANTPLLPSLSTFVLSKPFLIPPGEANTKTFLNFGTFNTRAETEHLLKYLHTKFVRAMISAKKVTQHNNPKVWVNVPLQDFTDQSDIDWSKTIPEIDQQLYAKYGLSKDEIGFIETKIKDR